MDKEFKVSLKGIQSALEHLHKAEAKREGLGGVYISFTLTLYGTTKEWQLYTPKMNHQTFKEKQQLIDCMKGVNYDPSIEVRKRIISAKEELKENKRKELDIKHKIQTLSEELEGLKIKE